VRVIGSALPDFRAAVHGRDEGFNKMNLSPQAGKSVKSPAAQLIMNIHQGRDFSENEFEKKGIMVTDNAELLSDSSPSRPPVSLRTLGLRPAGCAYDAAGGEAMLGTSPVPASMEQNLALGGLHPAGCTYDTAEGEAMLGEGPVPILGMQRLDEIVDLFHEGGGLGDSAHASGGATRGRGDGVGQDQREGIGTEPEPPFVPWMANWSFALQRSRDMLQQLRFPSEHEPSRQFYPASVGGAGGKAILTADDFLGWYCALEGHRDPPVKSAAALLLHRFNACINRSAAPSVSESRQLFECCLGSAWASELLFPTKAIFPLEAVARGLSYDVFRALEDVAEAFLPGMLDNGGRLPPAGAAAQGRLRTLKAPSAAHSSSPSESSSLGSDLGLYASDSSSPCSTLSPDGSPARGGRLQGQGPFHMHASSQLPALADALRALRFPLPSGVGKASAADLEGMGSNKAHLVAMTVLLRNAQAYSARWKQFFGGVRVPVELTIGNAAKTLLELLQQARALLAAGEVELPRPGLRSLCALFFLDPCKRPHRDEVRAAVEHLGARFGTPWLLGMMEALNACPLDSSAFEITSQLIASLSQHACRALCEDDGGAIIVWPSAGESPASGGAPPAMKAADAQLSRPVASDGNAEKTAGDRTSNEDENVVALIVAALHWSVQVGEVTADLLRTTLLACDTVGSSPLMRPPISLCESGCSAVRMALRCFVSPSLALKEMAELPPLLRTLGWGGSGPSPRIPPPWLGDPMGSVLNVDDAEAVRYQTVRACVLLRGMTAKSVSAGPDAELTSSGLRASRPRSPELGSDDEPGGEHDIVGETDQGASQSRAGALAVEHRKRAKSVDCEPGGSSEPGRRRTVAEYVVQGADGAFQDADGASSDSGAGRLLGNAPRGRGRAGGVGARADVFLPPFASGASSQHAVREADLPPRAHAVPWPGYHDGHGGQLDPGGRGGGNSREGLVPGGRSSGELNNESFMGQRELNPPVRLMSLRRLTVFPGPPSNTMSLPRYPMLSSRRSPLTFKTRASDIDWVLSVERRALAHELHIGDSVGVYGAEIDHPYTTSIAGVVVRHDNDFVTLVLGAAQHAEVTVAKRYVYGRAFTDALPSALQPGFWLPASGSEEWLRRSALLYSLTVLHLRGIIYADPSFAAPGDDDISLVVAQERARRSARVIKKFVSGPSCFPLDVSRFDNYRLAQYFFKRSDMPPIPSGSLVGDFVLLTSVSFRAVSVHLLLPAMYSQSSYSGYVYAELASLVVHAVAQQLREGLPLWMSVDGGCRVRAVPTLGRPHAVDDDAAGQLPSSLLSSIAASSAFSIGHVLLEHITNGRDLAIVIALIRKGAFAGAVSDLMAHGAVGRIGGIHCPGQPKVLGKYLSSAVRRKPKLQHTLTAARALGESVSAGWSRVQFYNLYCSRLIGLHGFSRKILVQSRLIAASKLFQQPGTLPVNVSWPDDDELAATEIPLLESLLLDAIAGLEAHIREFQDWWSSFSPTHCPSGLRIVRGEASFGDARGYFRAFNLLPSSQSAPVDEDDSATVHAALHLDDSSDGVTNPWSGRGLRAGLCPPTQPPCIPERTQDDDDDDVSTVASVEECDV